MNYVFLIFGQLVFTVSGVNKASKHGVRIKNRCVTTRCQGTSATNTANTVSVGSAQMQQISSLQRCR